MRRVSGALKVALLLAALSTSSSLPARDTTGDRGINPGPSTVGTITLYQSAERVLVMMQIADGDLLPMVFDTGSDGATIDHTLARRLRLKKIGQVQEIDGTTGKERLLPMVSLRGVTLGGLKVGSIEAASVDYDRNDAMGIVSSEMFTDSLLYLDLSNNRALLVPRSARPAPAVSATQYVSGIPSIHIVMPDGSTLPAHFDTGFNGALSLPVSMMDKVPLYKPAKIVGRFKSINTEGSVYGGRVKGKIKIGPVTLDNPNVTFLGDLANIGLPIIRQVTLVIDAAADQNWVLAPGAHPESAK
jgi:predicted aspartyl protease